MMAGDGGERPKVAIVVSHPIQHFCPMYRSVADADFCDLRVFFASSAGLKKQWDPNFGRDIQWDDLTLAFPHQFLNGGAALPLGGRIDARDLEAALAAYDPHVVIVYGYSQPLQRRALRWGTQNHRRILMISDSERRQHQTLVKRVLKRVVLPRIYSRVHGFLTVGDANEDYYRTYGASPKHLFRAPFPIDRTLLDPVFAARTEHARHLRTELEIPDDAIVCTVVGKLVPWKRQRDLIEAMALLRDCARPLTALIIGTGQDERDLRRVAREIAPQRVIFAGFVQPRELARYYATTDIYVHPSSVEPHSLAITEAIYMGCPAVVSDRCGSYGTTDDVRPERNGLVYECGDTQALATAIRRLAESDSLRQEFGAESRNIAIASQQLAHGAGLRAALNALGIV